MSTSVDLREEWAKSIYSNFSSHSCIHHEVKILEKAIVEKDNVFSDFLRINIARRKKRVAGISIEPEYLSFIDFFEKHKNTLEFSDAILAALSARIGACACSLFSNANVPDPIIPIDLFSESKKLIDKHCTDTSQFLAREAIASVNVALINEQSRNASSAKSTLVEYDNLIASINDYLPAYFDRASFALNAHQKNSHEFSADKIVSLFQSTANAAAAFDNIELTVLDDTKALEESSLMNCTPSSALPLALKQLGIVKAICNPDPSNKGVYTFLLSNLSSLESNRFDNII